MGMLDRYKKTGGFLQLLNLIETCGPQKQEKFLKIIEEESPDWANAIKTKCLSMDKIFTWNMDYLREIFSRVQELTLATALHGFDDKKKNQVHECFSHSQKRRIDDLFGAGNPTPAEISASYMKIIEEVRSMVQQGYIKFDKIDPSLVIEDDIEEKLIHGKLSASSKTTDVSDSFAIEYEKSPASEPAQATKAVSDPRIAEELSVARKKLVTLSAEVTRLNQENKLLKSKLDQIKKIA